MSIDPQAARLLRMLGTATRSGTGRIGIDERRRSFDGLMRLSGPAPEVGSVEDKSTAGLGTAFDHLEHDVVRKPVPTFRHHALGLRLYTPLGRSGARLPGLIYFHGGGLVAGSLDSYDVLCRILSNASGCRVVAVDYRLAPEHPFPAAIEDAMRATAHVLDEAESFGLDPDRIALGGDSAGGTLTAIVTQAFRDRAGPKPRVQVLLCPVLDFVEERPSKRDFGQGYLLDSALMTRDLDDLAPNRPLSDPLISPLRAPALAGLPPALIHTAGFDPLRDEGRAYADRLEEAGVAVRYTCHETMIHHFYGLTGMLPAARSILAAIGGELAEVMATPTP